MSLNHLNSSRLSSALHARRHIHRIPPNIVVRLPGANYSGRYRTMVDAHFQDKMVERLLVDALQRFLQLERKVDEQGQMFPSNGNGVLGLEII